MVEFLEIIKQKKDLNVFKILDGQDSFYVTRSDFYKEIMRCANYLNKRLGNLEGKHIGIYLDSCYEYTALLCAILFNRAVAVPLIVLESVDNIKYEIMHADLDALVISDSQNEIKKEITVETINIKDLFSGEYVDYELKDFSDDEEKSLAMIVYTSGTTGVPKGVMLSVGNLFKYPKALADDNSPFDHLNGITIYNNFPFYHVAGIYGFISRMEEECITYLSTNPGNILMDLENEKVDCVFVIPSTLKLWEKAIRRGSDKILGDARLITTAGAPANFEVVQGFLDRGLSYGQYYGMTETTGNISFNFDCSKHLKSVGRPDEMTKVTIEDGEICVTGPGVMLGYYKDSEATAECMQGETLHTGDLGYVDEDGYVYITGRKKNLIILSGGENVSPEELERLISKNEKVIECRVYAADDRICADIFADGNNADEVKNYVASLNKTLPIYKKIHKVNVQNAPLEKTSIGKIKR